MNGQTNAGGSAGGLRVVESGVDIDSNVTLPTPASIVVVSINTDNAKTCYMIWPGQASGGSGLYNTVALSSDGIRLTKRNFESDVTFSYIAFA